MQSSPHLRPPARRPPQPCLPGAVAVVLVAGWLASVAVAPAAPQEGEGAAPPAATADAPYFEAVEVNVVNVVVHVTDPDGEPVTGLTADDFEVYEDGRRVPVSNFFAVSEGRPVAAAPSGPAPPDGGEGAAPESPQAEAAAEPAEAEPPPLPEDQRLHLIVYFDNLNIRPTNRRWVIDPVRRFLYRHLGEGDRAMLVTYDRALHIRQPFSEDPQEVIDALEEVAMLTAGAATTDADRRIALEEIERARNVNSALQAARSHAQSLYSETNFAIAGLKDMVDSIAGLPGRKALVYVSDGVPMIAAEDLFVAVEQRFGLNAGRAQAFSFDLSRRYRELAAQANAAGVTFYAVDSRGLATDASISAENRGGARRGDLILIDSTRTGNLQAPLRLLAEETGGQTILNTNAVDAGLDRVAADFRSYYSLGYSPAHTGDGRYHEIEVRLPGHPKLEVRHREGYRDKTFEARLAEANLATLQFGFEDDPLGVAVSFGLQEEDEEGRWLVPLEVRIPIGSLTLVPREEVYRGRVQVSLSVIDGEGDISPVQQQPYLDLRIPAGEVAAARGQDYIYEVTLLMRPGPHRVAVAVRDAIANQAAFVAGQVEVGR